MLARYSNLRPQPRPDDPRSELHCKSGEQSAIRAWAEWESKIAHSDASRCLHGLDTAQRTQLAALLLETREAFEIREHQNSGAALRRYLANEARRRHRMLRRKLARARKAVQELKDYASDSAFGRSGEKTVHEARQMLGHDYLCVASHALAALDGKRLSDDTDFHEYSTAERAEGFGMVQLYWFFRHGCALSGDESEVRVGLIRTVFWTEYGVSKIPLRTKGQPEESKGCDAVRAAVMRLSRHWR